MESTQPSLFGRFFQPLSGQISNTRIWIWWEQRRLIYNLFVILTAFVALIMFEYFCATSGLIGPGEDAEEPMGILLAAIVGPILWNIAYFLGPIAEIMLSKGNPKRAWGPLLLKLGMAFSAFVVSIPALMWAGIWIYQAFHGFPRKY